MLLSSNSAILYPSHSHSQIEQQLGKQSFFGTIEAPQATEMLKKQKEGTYMLRFSGTVPGILFVSRKDVIPGFLLARF
jgi:hypothetical protein